tara:strand:- start:4359 stop:5081 length:723 start_codon:yes stop_codon:yes gene_type:complete
MLQQNIYIKKLVKEIIDTALENVTDRNNKKFYYIKYSSIKKNYISTTILYKDLFEDFLEHTYDVKDLLNKVMFTKNIIPIPFLNGKYLRENYILNELPSEILIIFMDMNILTERPTVNYHNSFSYIMNLLGPSNTSPSPWDPSADYSFVNSPSNATVINDLENSLNLISQQLNNTNSPNQPILNISNISTPEQIINNNKDRYKDEINVLKDMGFSDEYKIIESLIISNGDINSAIHYYLQ